MIIKRQEYLEEKLIISEKKDQVFEIQVQLKLSKS